MAIPDFQSLMRPILEAIGDGKEYSNRDLARLVAERCRLTDDDLREMLPSGQNTVFTNRMAWAKAHLKKAGLLESPARGSVRITEQGQTALVKNSGNINIRFLNQFPAYDWHKKPKRDAENGERGDEQGHEVASTPEELLDASYVTLRDELARNLLERVKGCSPLFFERLVVRLLVAMGYGGSLVDAGQAIGRAGDGGIDGIIKEDKLGLDVVCIQAKRWENSVGRPVVQAFAGSMEGYRARKGVLLTTASFSRDAEEYAKQIERKIVLIDGKRLAELMIDHDIGVTTEQVYPLKKADQDYFSEDDA